MALSGAAKKPADAVKTKRPVTLKHLAAVLAEEHQLTKRAGAGTSRRPRQYNYKASEKG